MPLTTRALVALVAAGALIPATVAARMQDAAPRRTSSEFPTGNCPRTYTAHMFARAARIVYHRARAATRSDLGALHRYAACSRTLRSHARAEAFWARARDAWRHARLRAARDATTLPYGRWAIPATIVMCESGGQNLVPNSAGASGYYQIIPGTWQSYGGGRYASEAYLASKPGQDAIAGRIWAGGSGASQWVCKA